MIARVWPYIIIELMRVTLNRWPQIDQFIDILTTAELSGQDVSSTTGAIRYHRSEWKRDGHWTWGKDPDILLNTLYWRGAWFDILGEMVIILWYIIPNTAAGKVGGCWGWGLRQPDRAADSHSEPGPRSSDRLIGLAVKHRPLQAARTTAGQRALLGGGADY